MRTSLPSVPFPRFRQLLCGANRHSKTRTNTNRRRRRPSPEHYKSDGEAEMLPSPVLVPAVKRQQPGDVCNDYVEFMLEFRAGLSPRRNGLAWQSWSREQKG